MTHQPRPSSSARRLYEWADSWVETKRIEEQRVLASLIRWAQEHPHATGYAAGPTTDPATVADRILRGGRIKVQTKGAQTDGADRG